SGSLNPRRGARRPSWSKNAALRRRSVRNSPLWGYDLTCDLNCCCPTEKWREVRFESAMPYKGHYRPLKLVVAENAFASTALRTSSILANISYGVVRRLIASREAQLSRSIAWRIYLPQRSARRPAQRGRN